MIEAHSLTSPPIRTVEVPEPDFEPLLPPQPERKEEPVEPERIPAPLP